MVLFPYLYSEQLLGCCYSLLLTVTDLTCEVNKLDFSCFLDFAFLAKALLYPVIAMRTCQFDPIHLMVERNQYKPMHICTHINPSIPVSFSLIQWEFLCAHTQHTQHIYKSYKTRDPCLPQLIDPLRHLDDPTPQSIGWFASVWQKVKPISGRARRKQFMWRRMDGDGCFL